MLLIHIYPEKPGCDQNTYECPRCEHEVMEVVSRLEPSETAKSR
jgi:hypothetical protein